MKYTVEALETYAACPRKYKFKYIEKAPHYITYREVLHTCHRKAIHACLQMRMDGEVSTPKTYADTWASEWTARSGAIGSWSCKPLSYKHALRIGEDFHDIHEWTTPKARDTLRQCRFGRTKATGIYVNTDFEYSNASLVICFRHAAIPKSRFKTSFVGVALQCLDWSKDIAVISFTGCGDCTRIRSFSTRLPECNSRRVIASMMDQVVAIENGSFPRCNPESNGCSYAECGYWRVCTRLSPRDRAKRKEKHYAVT